MDTVLNVSTIDLVNLRYRPTLFGKPAVPLDRFGMIHTAQVCPFQ